MKTEITQSNDQSAPRSEEVSEIEAIELSFTDLELDAVVSGIARRC